MHIMSLLISQNKRNWCSYCHVEASLCHCPRGFAEGQCNQHSRGVPRGWSNGTRPKGVSHLVFCENGFTKWYRALVIVEQVTFGNDLYKRHPFCIIRLIVDGSIEFLTNSLNKHSCSDYTSFGNVTYDDDNYITKNCICDPKGHFQLRAELKSTGKDKEKDKNNTNKNKRNIQKSITERIYRCPRNNKNKSAYCVAAGEDVTDVTQCGCFYYDYLSKCDITNYLSGQSKFNCDMPRGSGKLDIGLNHKNKQVRHFYEIGKLQFDYNQDCKIKIKKDDPKLSLFYGSLNILFM